jgi:hypothetical protein
MKAWMMATSCGVGEIIPSGMGGKEKGPMGALSGELEEYREG